jgi:hypothetical protein
MKIPLLDEGKQGVYTVRMGFVAKAGQKTGDQVLDISILDQTVAKDFDVAKVAGKAGKAVVKEFKGVKVTGDLNLAWTATGSGKPALQFLEIIREDVPPVKAAKLNVID